PSPCVRFVFRLRRMIGAGDMSEERSSRLNQPTWSLTRELGHEGFSREMTSKILRECGIVGPRPK
ncbi:hypothetical protein A2U01_0094269, partial [Trifolium medium]|nr:hypothetical protein [Trifolium medium]